MPYVVWSPRALADTARLYRFLLPKSPDVAKRAVRAIQTRALLLERFPDAGRSAMEHGEACRELVVLFGSGAYVLLYRHLGDEVLIAAIRHSREMGYSDLPDLSGS